MLTNLRSLQRVIVVTASCLVGQVAGLSASAQTALRPSDPFAPGQLGYESTRQKPVSRSRTMREQPTANASTLPVSATSERQYEFAQLQREADAVERQFNLVRRIVRFTSPSIVHIEATKSTDPGKGFASSKIEEAGAGIIVEISGRPHVLTNRHVIFPADLSSIRLELSDGRILRATNAWTDPSTDVAVLQLDNVDLVPAVLGDSDKMQVGDFVMAVGSPFGLSHSVTYGIISAKGRRNLELGSKEIEIQDFFQTDAAINPGNSGGPLINLRGEIVGTNTAIASNSGGNEGIGFSIPINMAVMVAEQLIRRGKLARSYLGVSLENAFDSYTAQRLGLSSADGALIKAVIPSSPAEKSGLRVGDVIVEFNGLRIENDGHLVKQVGLTPVGSRVAMIIYRDGNAHRVLTTLEPAPE